ncbi:hypothetical protein CHUAL_012203 [Chamberlinius hualienensis]
MKFLYVSFILALICCCSVSGIKRVLNEEFGDESDTDTIKKWTRTSPKVKLPPLPIDGPIVVTSASERVYADTSNVTVNATKTKNCDPVERLVRNVYDEAVLGYYYLDFGVGLSLFNVRYSSFSPTYEPFYLQVFVDTEYGEPIAQLTTTSTGGWCTFRESTVFLSHKIAALICCCSAAGYKRKATSNEEYDSWADDSEDKSSRPFPSKCRSLPKSGIVYRRDASKVIIAGTFNTSSTAKNTSNCDPKIAVVRSIFNNSVIGYYHLDFGLGLSVLKIRYSVYTPSPSPFEIRVYTDCDDDDIGTVDMKLIASIALSLLIISNCNGQKDVEKIPTKLSYNIKANRERKTQDKQLFNAKQIVEGFVLTRRATDQIYGVNYNVSLVPLNRIICEELNITAPNIVPNGTILGFYDLDFSSYGPELVYIYYSSGSPLSAPAYNIKIYIDDPISGTLITDYTAVGTGHPCKFTKGLGTVKKGLTGVHRTFFVIKALRYSPVDSFNLNWFQFGYYVTYNNCN